MAAESLRPEREAMKLELAGKWFRRETSLGPVDP